MPGARRVEKRTSGEAGRAAPGLSWGAETRLPSFPLHGATRNSWLPLRTSGLCSRATRVLAGRDLVSLATLENADDNGSTLRG